MHSLFVLLLLNVLGHISFPGNRPLPHVARLPEMGPAHQPANGTARDLAAGARVRPLGDRGAVRGRTSGTLRQRCQGVAV